MIVTQGSERSHLAPDNSPVASRRAHPAPKRANPAEIKRYNGQLLVVAGTGNVEDMRRLKGAGADVECKDSWGKTALDGARRGAQGSWSWSERCRAVAAWLEAFMEKKEGGEAGD
jgi:hypothetical protein